MADETVDVIISNCVVNLSPDKPQVFREAYRVLRSGGKLAVSDIVTRGELAPEVKKDLNSWAGCVAGATIDTEYVAAIKAAGFVDVTITIISRCRIGRRWCYLLISKSILRKTG